jgi:multidrug transporter EmrE-like cation transporter
MTLLYLVLAIAFEVAWAIAMKVSSGLTRPVPAAVTVVAYILSLVFLSLATRRMEIGAAYAVWAGSGAAIIATIGILYVREPVTALKLASMGLIIAGIVGLQVSAKGH